MEIEITEKLANTINLLCGSVLYIGNRFYIIQCFRIETIKKEKLVKHLFKKDEIVITNKIYLTSMVMGTYAKTMRKWGVVTEEGIENILYYNDLLSCRNNYLDMIKTPLELLGVEFKFDEEKLKK